MGQVEKWIDNSKAGALERCPRSFWFRYVADLTSLEENDKIAFGKSVHYAFEQVFDQVMFGESDRDFLVEVFVETGTLFWQQMLPSLDPSVAEETYFAEDSFASIANQWFEQVWPMLTGQLKAICGTELVVRFRLPEPAADWTYICRADLVYKDLADNYVLIDHKTTGWSPTMLLNSLEADTQLPSYCMALSQKFGKPVSVAMLNVIQYSRRWLKSGTLSKPTLKTELFPVVISPQRLEMMLCRYAAAAKEIERRLETNNWCCQPSACGFKGRTCEFFILCERFWKEDPCDSHIEQALQLGFRQEKWEPFGKGGNYEA